MTIFNPLSAIFGDHVAFLQIFHIMVNLLKYILYIKYTFALSILHNQIRFKF